MTEAELRETLRRIRAGSIDAEQDIWDAWKAGTFTLAQTEQLKLEWRVGSPTKPWSEEWFIAETIWGDRVVLRALPEEWTYDFKTADDTYIKHDKIKRWMQFPDSEYIAPDASQPPAAPVADYVSVGIDKNIVRSIETLSAADTEELLKTIHVQAARIEELEKQAAPVEMDCDTVRHMWGQVEKARADGTFSSPLPPSSADTAQEAIRNYLKLWDSCGGSTAVAAEAFAEARQMMRDALNGVQPHPSADNEKPRPVRLYAWGGQTRVNDYLMSDGSVKAMTLDEAKAAGYGAQPQGARK